MIIVFKKVLAFSIAPFVLLFPFLWNTDFHSFHSKEFIGLGNIDINGQEIWVDSVFNTLTAEEKIGQLFMVAAYSNRDEVHYQAIDRLVLENKIGGLIFFQGTPNKQAELTNRYQSLCDIPMLIAIDGEWGLGMRLDSTMSFPRQMTLGAIQDDKLIYEMGVEVARQCKRIGIHINFAPVVDINSNPLNPVIGSRSFGEDKENVAKKGIAYMKGMQDNGLIANAKHFPGHGDTQADSHFTLPSITHDQTRLRNTELYPFQELIDNGLMSIMVAHLFIPAFDNRINTPTTLSENIITHLLKEEMGFRGLIFTDALSMKGITNYYKTGEIDLLALMAGNDVLLFPDDVPFAIKTILAAIQRGKLSQELVDQKVRKILRTKYQVGLNRYKPIELKNLYEDLNTQKAQLLNEKLYQKAITLVKNSNNLIPFQRPDTISFASVCVSVDDKPDFRDMLKNYAGFNHYFIDKYSNKVVFDTLINSLAKYEVVVIGIHDTDWFTVNDYGVNWNTKYFIETLSSKTKVVVVSFALPYSLSFFPKASHLICANEDNKINQKLIPQMLFGAFASEGILPVSVSEISNAGSGFKTVALKRLAYNIPESVGLDSKILTEMEDIIYNAINEGAMPGCQVLVAKKGTVVWNKGYGHQTYDKTKLVNTETIYDIASVSKMLGTLQAIQYLYDLDSIQLDKEVSSYLPEMKNTDKSEITVKEVLLHQAGLIPYIPHWARTIHPDKTPKAEYYSYVATKDYPNQVANRLFSIKAMEDSLWKWSMDSKIDIKAVGKERYQYAYSDLGFYIMKRLAEKMLKKPMEDFLSDYYYNPLGLRIVGYNPLKRFPISRIVPTEQDNAFRNQLVHGTVHDQGAAMLGGVGGHAGLFSNTRDLAVLMQLQLQKGFYGGKRYFSEKTMDIFTRSYNNENRRGLGWDKPDKESLSYFPAQSITGSNVIGHSGFTGCVVWADYDREIVFIFLSNRINTNAENQKMIQQHIRRKLIEIVYKANN